MAAALLSMLGSVVGARCGIRPKAHDPWFGVPNLWGAIVGQPASKKTPAMNAATRPLDRLIGDVKAALRGDLEAFEYEKMVREAKAKALKDQLNQSAKNSRGDGPEVFVNRLREHNKAEPRGRNAASRRSAGAAAPRGPEPVKRISKSRNFLPEIVLQPTLAGGVSRRGQSSRRSRMLQFIHGADHARFLGLDAGDWSVLVGGGCALAGLVLLLA